MREVPDPTRVPEKPPKVKKIRTEPSFFHDAYVLPALRATKALRSTFHSTYLYLLAALTLVAIVTLVVRAFDETVSVPPGGVLGLVVMSVVGTTILGRAAVVKVKSDYRRKKKIWEAAQEVIVPKESSTDHDHSAHIHSSNHSHSSNHWTNGGWTDANVRSPNVYVNVPKSANEYHIRP